MSVLSLYIDGASLGNPGSSGAGIVVYEGIPPHRKLIVRKGFYIGKQTNNFAEYAALLLGLSELRGKSETKLTVFSDSELLCRQLQGVYRVKHENLIFSHNLAKILISGFKDFQIKHIPREENGEADALSKKSAELKINI
jgi:ribonuclease HI